MTKLIKVMDTSFRDGFQSIYGAKVLVDDFIPALQAAVSAGLRHFETAGGARFQAPIFFEMQLRLSARNKINLNNQTCKRSRRRRKTDTRNSDKPAKNYIKRNIHDEGNDGRFHANIFQSLRHENRVDKNIREDYRRQKN